MNTVANVNAHGHIFVSVEKWCCKASNSANTFCLEINCKDISITTAFKFNNE